MAGEGPATASRDPEAQRMVRGQEIFLSVQELEPAARSAAIDRACGEDRELRELVLLLLRGAEAPLGIEALADELQAVAEAQVAFGEEAWRSVPAGGGAGGGAGGRSGGRIGNYRVIERLGEGGFGVVFLAEQEQPVRRRVALKVIKLGMDTRQTVARFEAERQALAMMEHPGIAKVFDAGATETGRPFFVMELVTGRPITRYCDEKTLDIRSRLSLFVQVCEAAQHAHGKGIIHRDLKPSNVLVTETDGRAVPKIIDFGIAKAISGTLTDKTLYTQARQMIGTPEYMSPEQASMSGLDVDTRSDVYSLGVMLYELLAGVTPIDGDRLRSAPYGEAQRIIAEEDPPRPSTKVSTRTGTIAAIAASRGCDPRTIASTLRGELDWIAMRAMEKDRARRYDSASALAADVNRYLAGEAVTAVPPSRAYQARKFVRRNRVVVTAATVAGMALVVGAAGFAWQARVARSQRDEAIGARARAETTMEFLLSVLRKGDPDSGVGGDTVTIEQAMQSAIGDLESGRFSGDPETEARLWMALADVLQSYTREKQAAGLYQRALDALRRRYTGDHPSVAAAMSRLAYLRYSQFEDKPALSLAQDAVAMLERLGMDGTDQMLGAVNILDIIRPTSGGPERIARRRRIYEMHRRLHPNDNEPVVSMMWNLGSALVGARQFEEGERLMIEALEMSRRLRPNGAAIVSHALGFVGQAKYEQGDFAEAERWYAEAITEYRRFVRQDTLESAKKMYDLAWAQWIQDKPSAAEVTCTRALEYLRAREHPLTASVLGLRARSFHQLGRYREARVDFDESIALWRRLTGRRAAKGLADALFHSALTRLKGGEIITPALELLENRVLTARNTELEDELYRRIREVMQSAQDGAAGAGTRGAR